jgi:hypothetical protein
MPKKTLEFEKLRQREEGNKILKLISVEQKKRQRNEIAEIQSGLNHARTRFNTRVL